MPTYTCEKCARVFKQKSGFDDHKAKKIDCAQNTVLNAVIETKVVEKVKEVIRATQQKPEITKETLPGFFEDLHNLLWNKAGLNPERALEHMTFFFAYRLIEQQADTLNLPQECRWSYIASIKNAHDLFETIKKGVVEFRKRPKTKAFFKQHEIQKADIVFEIVEQINRISLTILQETDTLGDIFEYMLGRGMSTMSDEGQYFTNRAICKLAFKLAYDIKKTLRRSDGSLCTFADWFCGTGGFPAEYVKGVKANLKDVDWKKDSGSVYCQDMNLSSVTTTLLNLLILTGIPFSNDKIRGSNSFTESIITGASAPFSGLTVDYSFMNPPYGGDKSKGKEYKFAYSKEVKGEDGVKTKKFFVNPDIQSIGIEDDDKVSAGVQLSMATLSADGGVCAIVLPQGFFFGAAKKCVELRKKIAEEYRIYYVVDIASGAFANTGTKTSMMVFQKGVGATEKVAFIGLDEKPLVEATLEELRAKHYSLNYKQYLPQSAVEVEGFEMVKLSDIVSFKAEKSKKDKTSYTYIDIGSVDRGNFKAGESISKVDLPGRAQYSVNIGDILLGTVRPNLEHYLLISPQVYRDDLIVSNGFSIMRCDTTKVLPTYLYSILTLPSTTAYLTERATGTTYPVVDDTIIGEMTIPLPSLERQAEIVEAIDSWAILAQQEEVALKILEKQLMFQVKEMGRGQVRVKLESIATFTFGYGIKSEDFGETGLPIIKTKNFKDGAVTTLSGGNPRTEKKYDNKYLIRKGDLLMVVDGACGESAIWLENENGWLNQHVAKLHIENETTRMYVAFVMKGDMFKEYIQPNVVITTIPHMQRDVAKNFEIPLPPLTDQQTLQSDFDEIRHKHAKIAEYKAKAQAAIQRLIPGAASGSSPTPISESKKDEEDFSSTSTTNEVVVAEPVVAKKRVGLVRKKTTKPAPPQ
jgi:type I restriction-modification system DNA methylase subunit